MPTSIPLRDARRVLDSRTVVPGVLYVRLEVHASEPLPGKSALEEVISRALFTSFGVAGSAQMSIDIIHFDQTSQVAVGKVVAAAAQDVWSALTLVSNINDHPGRISVSHTSPFLLALAA